MPVEFLGQLLKPGRTRDLVRDPQVRLLRREFTLQHLPAMRYFGRIPGRELFDGMKVAAVSVSQFLLGDDVSPAATPLAWVGRIEPTRLPEPDQYWTDRLRQPDGVGFLGGAEHRGLGDLFRSVRRRTVESHLVFVGPDDIRASDLFFRTSHTMWHPAEEAHQVGQLVTEKSNDMALHVSCWN